MKPSKTIVLILQVKNNQRRDPRRRTTQSFSVSLPYYRWFFVALKKHFRVIGKILREERDLRGRRVVDEGLAEHPQAS